MAEFDEFSPPGYLTAKGEGIAIDSLGQLHVYRGQRTAHVSPTPLQWKLICAALVKVRRPDHHGPIALMIDKRSMIMLIRERYSILLSVGLIGFDGKQLGPVAVALTLRASEAGDLLEAARKRAPAMERGDSP